MTVQTASRSQCARVPKLVIFSAFCACAYIFMPVILLLCHTYSTSCFGEQILTKSLRSNVCPERKEGIFLSIPLQRTTDSHLLLASGLVSVAGVVAFARAAGLAAQVSAASWATPRWLPETGCRTSLIASTQNHLI